MAGRFAGLSTKHVRAGRERRPPRPSFRRTAARSGGRSGLPWPLGVSLTVGAPIGGGSGVDQIPPRGPRLCGAAAAAYKSVVVARATIDGVGYAPWFWARRGCGGWGTPGKCSFVDHPAAHAGAPPAPLAEQSPAFQPARNRCRKRSYERHSAGPRRVHNNLK